MEAVNNRVSVTASELSPNALCDVIILVDVSASLSGVFHNLMGEYILPCLEYFSGGSVRHPPSCDLQYGPVQFGLVTMNSTGLTYRQSCSYYPVTCDASRVLQWLKEMRFEGGLMEHSLKLCEGFAAVLELCDLMSTTREPCLGPDQTVERYCLLVCNFLPSSSLCVESMKYGGKTHQQLSKLMVERNLKVSVISPRNLLHFKAIFERGLVNTEKDTSEIISDSEHAIHAGHTVLFQGFTLKGLKKKREDELLKKAKEDELKQSTPPKYDSGMDTAPPANNVAQGVDKSGQLLSASYESKTPPNQSSPVAGTQNPSPSITKATPSSVVDENPASVPPPSVFPTPSPRDPSSVASPQSVSATITSVSPSSAGTAAPITRVPSSTQLHTRASFNGTLLPPSSAALQQNVQQMQVATRSLAQGVSSQIGVTSMASSQASHVGTVVPNPPNSLAQSSLNMSQAMNRTAQPSSAGMTAQSLPSSMAQGFPNVVATCTSLPTTSTSPILSQLGASSVGSQPASVQGQRQPVSSMAAAMAAAKSALLEASAQALPSRMGQIPTGINIPGQVGGASQGLTTPVMTNQPSMNVGLTNLVGSSQSSTTVTPTMMPSSRPQSGTQPSGAVMQSGMPGHQPRPPVGGVQHSSSPQPGVAAAQPGVQPQFGAQGPPGHVMGSQPQAGLSQNIGSGQQPVGGTQQSMSNPGMAPAQPGVVQQQQPGMVGAQGPSSVLSNALQQQPQQPPLSGAQQIVETGMQAPGQHMHSVQPGSFGGQVQQQPQATIWTGTVDVMDQQRGQRPVKRPMQCSISAKRENIPELHPEIWPQRLTMQAYPKQASSIIMSLMKLNQQQNMVRVVTFNFTEPTDQVYTLRLLMSTDQPQKHFGIVHFNSLMPQCIKALILVWNEKTMQFTGLIPLEQDKFVDVLKRVFSRRQTQPGQQIGIGGPQQPQVIGNPQQSGVSTLPVQQQQMVMSGGQPSQPGTSTDSSMMNPNASMNMFGIQTQPSSQVPQSRSEKNMQLEKIIMLLERSTPDQQQQIFQKMPQLTPDMQQSLLQRVHSLRLQKQQLQRQQQQQMHGINQQQQQQSVMAGQIPDVLGQFGGAGQAQAQLQQQRQPQQQGMPQGGLGMVGVQRPPIQAQQQQQQQQQPQAMDPNNFSWQSQ